MNPTVITGTIFEWILAGDIGILNYMLTSLGIIPHAINFLSSAQTALGSIIFANIWVGIPFNMIILLSGLQGIPGELYESAVIDLSLIHIFPLMLEKFPICTTIVLDGIALVNQRTRIKRRKPT